MSRFHKKPPAHKRGHPTLQNMNFFYFCGSFLPSWIRIRIRIQITDPDPMVRLNTDPIRIRIRNPELMPIRIWIRLSIWMLIQILARILLQVLHMLVKIKLLKFTPVPLYIVLSFCHRHRCLNFHYF
jgi:hypothetical protein